MNFLKQIVNVRKKMIDQMTTTSSITFFDTQFQRQVRDGDFALNPFEKAALPFLRGRVLDFGCGLGNLAVAAAERGCSVVALDASHSAIEHLRQVASDKALPIEAYEAELRDYELREDFDAVVRLARVRGAEFFYEPQPRFQGKVEEHSTFVLKDPSNNLIEFKHYLDPRMMY